MPYTLAAAAAATGLSKTTIFRAIKSGKISGSKDVNGEWEVEPAELHRVYPPFAEGAECTDAPQHHASVHATAAVGLELKLAVWRSGSFTSGTRWMRCVASAMHGRRRPSGLLSPTSGPSGRGGNDWRDSREFHTPDATTHRLEHN